jgi:hypothetical protein
VKYFASNFGVGNKSQEETIVTLQRAARSYISEEEVPL